MDKTPITNFALRLSSTKSTGQQSDKGFQDVTAPFQFLTGNNQASKSQGFHLAGPSFLRSSFNLPENPKIHENTPTKEFNAETNYSPFRFPGLRAGGNLTSTGGEKPTVQSVSCEQVVQGAHKLVHGFSAFRYSTSELDQGLVKPKEESAETLPTGTSEPEEDLFLTITTKYRQAQREAARQREISAELEAQLTKKSEENAALSISVATQKQTLHKVTEKNGLFPNFLSPSTHNHSYRYSELKIELENLKTISTSSAAFLTEAKETMRGLVDLRDEAQFGLRGLESAFDDDGKLILTYETRTTVEELRLELSKTQQVADLLRDKLHSMASELAEARSRVLELEGLVAGDMRSIENITLQLQDSTKHISTLVGYLHEQRNESVRAAAEVYEMLQQLNHASARVKEVESELATMTRRFSECRDTAEEQKVQLHLLRNTVAFQENNLKDLEARAEKASEDLRQALGQSRELEVRLDAAKDREKNLLEQNQLLLSEKDTANQTLRALQNQTAEAHMRELSLSRQSSKITTELDIVVAKNKDLEQEANLYRRKHAVSSGALKALQKQFDEQSVALGNLQEQLHSAELRTSEVASDFKSEIAYLREQKGSLEARLDTALREGNAKSEMLIALRTEASRKEGAIEALLHEEKQRGDEGRRQIVETESKVQSLHRELDLRNKRVQDMEKCLAKHADEVAKLTSRVAELAATEQALSIRAMTITQRYAKNDLNDDEKTLVTTLMQKARTLHDREIVEKSNEIKRRDNLIKQCEARISQLERNLARRIHEPQMHSTSEVTATHTLAGDSPLTDPETKSATGLEDQPEGQPTLPKANPFRDVRSSKVHIHPTILSTSPKQLPMCLGFSNLATESNDSSESPPGNHLLDTPVHPVAISTSSKQLAGSPSFSELAPENDDSARSGEGCLPMSSKRATFAEGGTEVSTSRPARRRRCSKPTEGDKSVDKVPQQTAKKKTTKRR